MYFATISRTRCACSGALSSSLRRTRFAATARTQNNRPYERIEGSTAWRADGGCTMLPPPFSLSLLARRPSPSVSPPGRFHPKTTAILPRKGSTRSFSGMYRTLLYTRGGSRNYSIKIKIQEPLCSTSVLYAARRMFIMYRYT